MRSVAIYALIGAVSIGLVLNPAVVLLLTGERSFAVHVGLLDLWLVLIAAAALWYLRRPHPALAWTTAALVALLPAYMLAGEIAWSYVRYKYGDRLLGRIPAIHQPDPLLGYTLIPEAVGRHTRTGEFDVEYVIDAQGRKAIENVAGVARTLHVFGDSFAFGFGVGNQATWLNRLRARLGDALDVQNWGVIGYGLEQMYLAFERNAEAIRPGDVVLFAPIAVDLQRGLAAGTYVCGNLILGQVLPGGSPTFPKFEDGRWVAADLREECNFLLDAVLANTRLRWSLGALWRSFLHRQRHEAIMASADRVFAAARDLAEARGADFHVVFLPTPEECRSRAFTVALDDLETPWRTLMPFCPDEPGAAGALRFPHDSHWSPAGHAWAADALGRLLPALLDGRAATARPR